VPRVSSRSSLIEKGIHVKRTSMYFLGDVRGKLGFVQPLVVCHIFVNCRWFHLMCCIALYIKLSAECDKESVGHYLTTGPHP